MDNCPFCTLSPDRVIAGNEHALAFLDSYPVADGHVLVIPRLHIASIFGLESAGQAAVWTLVEEVRTKLAAARHPHGFTIGTNDGIAAGQTIPHAHVHVIPRWDGDVPDPRGGVRWVIPGKADYWSKA